MFNSKIITPTSILPPQGGGSQKDPSPLAACDELSRAGEGWGEGDQLFSSIQLSFQTSRVLI